MVVLLSGCASLQKIEVGGGSAAMTGPNYGGGWGPAAEVNVLTGTDEVTGVRGEIGVGGSAVADDTNFGRLHQDELTVHTGLRYYFLGGKVRPYLGAGGQMGYLHAYGEGESADAVSAGVYARGGVEVLLTEKMSVALDYKAQFLSSYHVGGEDLRGDRGQISVLVGWGF